MGKTVSVYAGTDRLWDEIDTPWTPKPLRPRPLKRHHYKVHELRRWLNVDYPDLVDQVTGYFLKAPLAGECLVVDQTGVGRAVVDQFVRAAGRGNECPKCAGRGYPTLVLGIPAPSGGACPVCGGKGRIKLKAQVRPVTITAGSNATADGAGWRVAKKELVSVLQVVLQTKRLKVASELAEARTLLRELETFKVKITAAANESFESWREKDHDDLVLALALAIWAAERGVQEFWVR